jgi:hypothetical protein
MAWILLADSQPLFNEALATVHRFRPELVLVDATIGLDGSPRWSPGSWRPIRRPR